MPVVKPPVGEMDARTCLEWISRSAQMSGPLGLTLYAIPKELMERAEELSRPPEDEGK